MSRLRAVARAPWAPFAVLAVVSVLSLAFRAAWLSDPCANPCRGEAAHSLIFDEVYYVNAARRIDGLAVPRNQPYAGDPAGQDDNSEHPQLVKLIIAGAIDVFGDGPFAWRVGSLIFGSLAILGMFALALAAGAPRWCAVLAATLMAADNLMVVHGRIATLDIYVVAFMVSAAAAYLRGRPIVAGVGLVPRHRQAVDPPRRVDVVDLVEDQRVRRRSSTRLRARVAEPCRAGREREHRDDDQQRDRRPWRADDLGESVPEPHRGRRYISPRRRRRKHRGRTAAAGGATAARRSSSAASPAAPPWRSSDPR